MVARGSRSGKSRLKGLLRPFMPLKVSWYMRSDLGTLTGAEVSGAPLALLGDALMSGYYLNELLLNLLHRHDPNPEIFDAYYRTVRELAGGGDIAPSLRRFEMNVLSLLGYALNLAHDRDTQDELSDDTRYEYRPGHGPVPALRETPLVFSAQMLGRIHRQEFDDEVVLLSANRLLRAVVDYHLEGRELKSRKVLVDLKRSERKTEARN